MNFLLNISAGHFLQYPSVDKMVAYGEFRAPYRGAVDDNRFVFYGMRYIVETYLARQWTARDLDDAERFFSTHNAGASAYPWPRELFWKFVRENDGYFPVRVQALPEGTCAHIHVPVYQITAEADYAPLITYLETLLTHVWYPSTVATLARRTRELLEREFARSVDGADAWQLNYRLHDFGFRGCTCTEQAVLGGAAHLLSFDGTDNMAAAYYAQYALNGGRPVASSIPASEHSVMTAWHSERAAIENMIDKFGSGMFSVVMDSYDYRAALERVLPAVAGAQKLKGGCMVLRPDSGDPVEVVLMALHAAERCFGTRLNARGYKVLLGAAVIQGDGVGFDSIQRMLAAVHGAGFSAQCVAYGMGGGLLQRVDRDTMSFATKLSHLRLRALPPGAPPGMPLERDIMKKPKSDSAKISLPGVLSVRRVHGVPTVFPADAPHDALPHEPELLQVVYDRRPVPGFKWDSFEVVRARVRDEWARLPAVHDPVSAPLKQKIQHWIANHVVQL